MVDLWNYSSLLQPPIRTTLHTGYAGAKKLTHILNGIINILSRQSPLHKESALLSRFLYKFDKKFRNDIGYRNLKKVSTALHKYLALNLLKDVQRFCSVLPSSGDEPYLPTRQMLEYLLVRLLTFSKIMFRICVCSKQAAVFYMDRVKRGESHWMSLMPYALLSRVWSLSQVLMEHATSWYSNLYTFLDKLDSSGVGFLSYEYELPNDLVTWLDLKNLDSYGKFSWSIEKYKISSKILENCDDIADNILDYVKQINEDAENEKDNLSVLDTRLGNESIQMELEELHEAPQVVDKGQTISREYFKKFFSADMQSLVKEKVHSSANVTNKTTLEQFIKNEESYRNKEDKRSLTSHLSFMQWQVLKSSLEKLQESLANNRKIERKFQKIWQEKCLDYV